LILVVLVAGLLFVWVATEAGWFGLSYESVRDLPMGLMATILVVLLVAWLWRRRAKWH
jgi:hypothetical protein